MPSTCMAPSTTRRLAASAFGISGTAPLSARWQRFSFSFQASGAEDKHNRLPRTDVRPPEASSVSGSTTPPTSFTGPTIRASRTVTIPARAAAVTFSLRGVDDKIVDGPRIVSITARGGPSVGHGGRHRRRQQGGQQFERGRQGASTCAPSTCAPRAPGHIIFEADKIPDAEAFGPQLTVSAC